LIADFDCGSKTDTLSEQSQPATRNLPHSYALGNEQAMDISKQSPWHDRAA
jgi:hypothetical protein